VGKRNPLFLILAFLLLVLTCVTGFLWWRSMTPREAVLDIDLEAKSTLMTAVYKVYGNPEFEDQWVARSVLKNEGPGRVTNLRFRYKLGEYSDWTDSEVYAVVAPGQTVVDPFHPVLSSRIAELLSASPAEIKMECTYTDPNGKTQTITQNKRTELRGRNEQVFTYLDNIEDIAENYQDFHANDPLLAAWVTKDCPVVEQTLGLAQQISGGVGAASNNDNALKLMESTWKLMAYNGISYQHPSSDVRRFNLIQHVKYPRDVLRNKSGTCIDLAICYAALLQSGGLKTVLITIPGHAFPAVRMPGGQLVAVETTMLSAPGKAKPFSDAVKMGMKELGELKPGQFSIVDVKKLRDAGVTEPQLPQPPADVMKAWSIKSPLQGGAEVARTDGTQVQKPVNNTPKSGLQPGLWNLVLVAPDGTRINGTCNVVAQGNQVQMVVALAYQQMGMDGMSHNCTERNTFQGSLTGQMFQAVCNQAVYTMDGRQVPPTGLPIRVMAQVSADGKSMQGTSTSSVGHTVNFTMRLAGP